MHLRWSRKSLLEVINSSVIGRIELLYALKWLSRYFNKKKNFFYTKNILKNYFFVVNILNQKVAAQSDRAVEYTDCISSEEYDSSTTTTTDGC